MKLLLATTNPGKLREIRDLLAGLPIVLATLADYPDVEAPEETGQTFAENARLKATYYAQRTGLMAAAEDSGLEIDALGGAPGVHSARYGGADSSYDEKFRLLFAALQQAADPSRAARFVCALALAAGDRVLFESRGVIKGQIAPAPRGSRGFGYDPIFFYPPFDGTLAEAGETQKSAVSHRGQAFRALRGWLESAGLERIS